MPELACTYSNGLGSNDQDFWESHQAASNRIAHNVAPTCAVFELGMRMFSYVRFRFLSAASDPPKHRPVRALRRELPGMGRDR